MHSSIAILLSRIRLPAMAAVLGLLIAGRFVAVLPGGWPVGLGGIALILVLMRAGTVRRPPVVVRPPVTGSWLALNSPATRVPSHGVQGYGQAYAIDLVYDPSDVYDRDGEPGGPANSGAGQASARPGFAWWPPARRPEEFPGFGQPVLAPADGVVVRVHDRERDHWSRNSPLGLLYVFTVELLREVFGPSRVVGNHVVIDLGDGVYAALMHLRRRSVRVKAGDRVRAGEQIAECGNSGNTSEPHLHFQLMDHRRIGFAAGLPFRFSSPDGTPLDMPRNGARLVVSPPAKRVSA